MVQHLSYYGAASQRLPVEEFFDMNQRGVLGVKARTE